MSVYFCIGISGIVDPCDICHVRYMHISQSVNVAKYGRFQFSIRSIFVTDFQQVLIIALINIACRHCEILCRQ